MIFPVIELVDRWAIAKLKFDKTGANKPEIDFYQQQLDKLDLALVQQDLDQLYSVHNEIWNLESELKTGKENLLTLEEIGRRAIKIRDWNHKRIELKNSMAKKLGQTIFEIKKDHLSE